MKTVTEIISKPSDLPRKKNGGMVTLFHPETEEIRDFWPVDAREAMKNGWQPKPEKVLLVEPAKPPVMSDVPIVPSAEVPAATEAPAADESIPSGSYRNKRRGSVSEPSDTR